MMRTGVTWPSPILRVPLLLALLSMVGACSAAVTPTPTPVPATLTPAPTPTWTRPPPTPTPSPLSSSETEQAIALLQERCTRCHADPLLNERQSEMG